MAFCLKDEVELAPRLPFIDDADHGSTLFLHRARKTHLNIGVENVAQSSRPQERMARVSDPEKTTRSLDWIS